MKPISAPKRKASPAPIFDPFQKMMDALLDVVCIVDANGCFVQVNKSSEAVLGYTSGEMLGKSFMHLVIEDDREKTLDAMQLLLSGIELNNFENRYYKKNGEVVLLSWSVRWDTVDALMYCIARDRTENKLAESLHLQYVQKVKRQNKQVADIMERITDGFFAVDDEWRVIYWNKQAENILQRSREEVLARNLWEFYPEERGGVFYQAYEKALTEQVVVKFEAYLQAVGIWIDVSAYPSENGLSVFFKDSTELRKVEEQLRVLSRIAEQTSNSVILTDGSNKITWVNEAFTRMTGYTSAEVVGLEQSALLHGPETDPVVASYTAYQKREGKAFKVELLNYKKDGSIYWSEVNCEPLLDEAGRVQQFFCIETDITERKKLQQQLEKEKEDQQKRITAAVIKAQENERAQVGQELHDNV
ncbi:MAG TPA: PAS domain S-box protein, partial [Flavisolibacter sp.]|nr:PAS domain S-box protein [Flavisolibacter sp.]